MTGVDGNRQPVTEATTEAGPDATTEASAETREPAPETNPLAWPAAISSPVTLSPTPARPGLTVAARAIGLLGGVGASLGLGAGIVARVAELPSYLTQNQLPAASRQILFACAAGGALGLILAISALVWWAARRQSATGPMGVVRMEEIGRRLAPLAVVGVFPALLDWRTWRDHDVDFLVLVSIVAVIADCAVCMALAAPPLFASKLADRPTRPPVLLRSTLRSQRMALGLVWLSVAGYALFFAFFTVRYHHNLHSTSYDLALEENILWNILHGFKFFRSSPFSGSSGSHFGNHATFFSYLLVPLYAIYPHAETLLVIQAIIMGAAAVPLFLFARRHLGSALACAIALTYLLYPPLHGAALYDFHYLPLGPLFLWSSLYCLEARKGRWALVFILLTVSVREDVAVGLGIVGAYLVISGHRPKAGLVVGAVGAATFVILKLIVMPRFAGHDSFVYMYSGLLPTGESTFGGVLKTVATNPGFTFASLIERDKLIYVLQLFVPLALLVFRRPLGMLFVTTGLLFTLLSTGYAPLIQTSFQYTTHWTSYLFIGLVATFRRLRSQDSRSGFELPVRSLGALAALACAIIPTTYQYGALLQQHTVRGGFGIYDFDTTAEELAQRAQVKDLLRRVPANATIAGSENLVPQFSNRAEAYTLRTGNFGAEYLFFTLPLRSDESPYVAGPIRDGEYGLVAMSGPFALAKRGYSTALNGTVIPRL